MKIRLPKIHLLLNSNGKLVDSDPRKSVHVVDGHAIVSNDIIAVVNLREYIKRELGVTEESEFKELSEFIDWMNGKSFNKNFWDEFTKEILLEEVDLKNDEVEISYSGFNKKLQYVQRDTNSERALQLLKANIMRDELPRERFAIGGEYLNLITKAFGNELKYDNLLFSMAEQGTSVRFSLNKKDYIFGVIPESFEASMDMMAFDNCSSVADILNGMSIPDIEESENQEEDFWNMGDGEED